MTCFLEQILNPRITCFLDGESNYLNTEMTFEKVLKVQIWHYAISKPE
jgi:hypothetical protein